MPESTNPKTQTIKILTHRLSGASSTKGALQALQTYLAKHHPFCIVMLQNVVLPCDADAATRHLFGLSSSMASNGASVNAGSAALGGLGNSNGRMPFKTPARAASAQPHELMAPPTRRSSMLSDKLKLLFSMHRANATSRQSQAHAASTRLGASDNASAFSLPMVQQDATAYSRHASDLIRNYPVHGYHSCASQSHLPATAHASDPGLMIYSTFPFVSTPAFAVFRDQSPDTVTQGMLVSEISIGALSHSIMICNVHFSPRVETRTRQIQETVNVLGSIGDACRYMILSGNFNMTMHSDDIVPFTPRADACTTDTDSCVSATACQLMLLMWKLRLETVCAKTISQVIEHLKEQYEGTDAISVDTQQFGLSDFVFASRELGRILELGVADLPNDACGNGQEDCGGHVPLAAVLRTTLPCV